MTSIIASAIICCIVYVYVNSKKSFLCQQQANVYDYNDIIDS